jgi:hypothetical protein
MLLQLFQESVAVPVISLFNVSLFIDSFLPWVRWLVQRRTRFDPRPVHVEYVVDKLALGQFCVQVRDVSGR